jgi:hypothetical protein
MNILNFSNKLIVRRIEGTKFDSEYKLFFLSKDKSQAFKFNNYL